MSANLYLAVHVFEPLVRSLHELDSFHASSLCADHWAQVSGGSGERMGEPRIAEDLRGRPNSA
jgi:hypothetical protein